MSDASSAGLESDFLVLWFPVSVTFYNDSVLLLTQTFAAYISECAPREIRGRLAGMYQLLNVTGIMLSFWVNYGLQGNTPHATTNDAVWRTAFFLQIIPGLLMATGILTQPESPRWLVEMGRYDDAARSLARLRVNVEIEDEIVQVIIYLSLVCLK